MRQPLLTSFLLFLSASTGIFAQEATISATTTPVGYMTQQLPASSSTYVGISTHHPVLISSTATATTSTTLSDTTLNFGELLTAGEAYLLEIESGAYKGTVYLINANKWRNAAQADEWNASTLTLPVDFGTTTPLEQNVAYKIRKATTVSDVFGANNEVCNLTASAFATRADTVGVTEYGTRNSYNIFYHSTAKEWRAIAQSTSVNKMPLFYQLPVLVKTLATSTAQPLTQIGEILTTEKAVEIKNNNDFVHTGYATVVPLAQSGMETSLVKNNFPAQADKVAVLNDSGNSFSFYFSIKDNQWKNVGGNTQPLDIKGPFAISRPANNVSHKYIPVALP